MHPEEMDDWQLIIPGNGSNPKKVAGWQVASGGELSSKVGCIAAECLKATSRNYARISCISL